MIPEELAKSCITSLDLSRSMGTKWEDSPLTLVTPVGWKRPPKFPRGELLQVKENGDRVWVFKAMRVLAWLAGNKLITLKLETAT